MDGAVDAAAPFEGNAQEPEGGTLPSFPDLFDVVASAGPVNVKSVRFLSPFRYPGGKTWLVPAVESWVRGLPRPTDTFVEPFAGGGIVALSVLADRLAARVAMAELDADVASVWQVALGNSDADFSTLAGEILAFPMSREAVAARLTRAESGTVDRAFRTIVRNRVNRGGIIAPGACMLNAGENNRGLMSRWYPSTLVRRLAGVRAMRARIDFLHGDAFDLVARHARDAGATFFVDPPYTAGGKKVGSGLYRHFAVDHGRLFADCASVAGAAMLTYDDVEEVVDLARTHAFAVDRVPMKSAHHVVKRELLATKPPVNP